MIKSFFHRLVAVFSLGVLVFSNNAVASGSCDSSFYSSYQSCVSVGSCSPFASPEEYRAAHPHCFPGGSSASQAQVSGTSFQQVGAISSALFSRLTGSSGPTLVAGAPKQGMAAGEKNAWNVWGNVAANDTNQSYSIGPQSIGYDVNVVNSVIGADYTVAPGTVIGVSGAFDRGDSTHHSIGNPQAYSTSKGYAIAPYIGYQLSKQLTLDASLGLGAGKVYSGGAAETDADRFFYAANLAYSSWIKDIQLTGKLGYLHGEEVSTGTLVNGTPIANTAGTNKLNRWQLGGQVGYWLGNGVQPYAGLSYLADRRSSTLAGADPIGKSAWQWALGLNFFSLASGITGGLLYTNEYNRSNQKNDALTANIGIRF